MVTSLDSYKLLDTVLRIEVDPLEVLDPKHPTILIPTAVDVQTRRR